MVRKIKAKLVLRLHAEGLSALRHSAWFGEAGLSGLQR